MEASTSRRSSRKAFCLSENTRAGGGHELPHAGGARHRHRLRIECALDERQQREVERHVAFVELLDDVIEVTPAALGHACDVVRALGVVLLPLANPLIAHRRHRIAGAQARPQVDACAGVVEVDTGLEAATGRPPQVVGSARALRWPALAPGPRRASMVLRGNAAARAGLGAAVTGAVGASPLGVASLGACGVTAQPAVSAEIAATANHEAQHGAHAVASRAAASGRC